MRLIKLISFVLLFCGVFASTAVVNANGSFNKADSEKILSRNKRLVFVPNGGVLKFVTGYLGPIDM